MLFYIISSNLTIKHQVILFINYNLVAGRWLDASETINDLKLFTLRFYFFTPTPSVWYVGRVVLRPPSFEDGIMGLSPLNNTNYICASA